MPLDLPAACAPQLPAELRGAAQATTVQVDGRPHLSVETDSDGTGLHATLLHRSWLVDPAACTALGLQLQGARGLQEQWSSFVGQGTPAEQAWLLNKAGYIAFDASKPEHALAAWKVAPPAELPAVELSLGALRLTARHAPPLDWHAGPAPARFEPAWISADDTPPDYASACPCYRIPESQLLIDHAQHRGSLRIHSYLSEQLLLTPGGSAAVVEDPARHRWAFYGDDPAAGDPVGTDPDAQGPPAAPPAALGGWRWSQTHEPEGLGITGVVADGADPWTWVSVDLYVQDEHGSWVWPVRVSWAEGGLLVQRDGAAPLLLPTEALLKLLGP